MLIITSLIAILTLAPKAYADMGEDAFKLQAYVKVAGKVGNICSVSLSIGMTRTKLCDTFKILDRNILAIKEQYNKSPERNEFYSLVQQTGGVTFENHQKYYFEARINLQALGELAP
jgi:hypothetical protein